ncbi:MAG: hypothetical protein MUF42_17540 [Cytophagaceae bacterium]|nr:hypothetical protein [Cytophagaceae bacterium]
MRPTRIWVVLMLVLATINSQAGILPISGVYQGKNLYVQNPFAGNQKDFCANEVYVNDVKVMSNIQSSAFEIDLSHLKMQEPVTIKITHKDDCKPKILNPQVIKQNSSFQFTSFIVDADHMTFTSKGEKPGSKMVVEHFLYNSWVALKEMNGKGSPLLNNYDAKQLGLDVKQKHHSGLNKYRIKYVDSDGQMIYSQIVEFKSDLAPLTAYPARVTDKLTLSRETDYEILDAVGTAVLKGRGKEVDMSKQTTGVYYLNADNQTIKLYKK